MLKDRAYLDAELLTAGMALPSLLSRKPVVVPLLLSRVALWADRPAILPAEEGHCVDAGLLIGKVLDGFD